MQDDPGSAAVARIDIPAGVTNYAWKNSDLGLRPGVKYWWRAVAMVDGKAFCGPDNQGYSVMKWFTIPAPKAGGQACHFTPQQADLLLKEKAAAASVGRRRWRRGRGFARRHGLLRIACQRQRTLLCTRAVRRCGEPVSRAGRISLEILVHNPVYRVQRGKIVLRAHEQRLEILDSGRRRRGSPSRRNDQRSRASPGGAIGSLGRRG